MSESAATNFQPKLIYLTRRHPGLSKAQFVVRWRRHGELGMSLPRWRNIARYVHCDVLEPAAESTCIARDYDGIGLIWHRSPQARAAHLADTSSRLEMERDEAETFAAPIVDVCLLARERVLQPLDKTQTPPFKLTRFLFGPAARDDGDANHESIAGCRGQVLNLPLPPERGDRWGLACSAIHEYWFLTHEQAVQGAAALSALADPTEAINVLSNEVLLYDASLKPGGHDAAR